MTERGNNFKSYERNKYSSENRNSNSHLKSNLYENRKSNDNMNFKYQDHGEKRKSNFYHVKNDFSKSNSHNNRKNNSNKLREEESFGSNNDYSEYSEFTDNYNTKERKVLTNTHTKDVFLNQKRSDNNDLTKMHLKNAHIKNDKKLIENNKGDYNEEDSYYDESRNEEEYNRLVNKNNKKESQNIIKNGKKQEVNESKEYREENKVNSKSKDIDIVDYWSTFSQIKDEYLFIYNDNASCNDKHAKEIIKFRILESKFKNKTDHKYVIKGSVKFDSLTSSLVYKLSNIEESYSLNFDDTTKLEDNEIFKIYKQGNLLILEEDSMVKINTINDEDKKPIDIFSSHANSNSNFSNKINVKSNKKCFILVSFAYLCINRFKSNQKYVMLEVSDVLLKSIQECIDNSKLKALNELKEQKAEMNNEGFENSSMIIKSLIENNYITNISSNSSNLSSNFENSKYIESLINVLQEKINTVHSMEKQIHLLNGELLTSNKELDSLKREKDNFEEKLRNETNNITKELSEKYQFAIGIMDKKFSELIENRNREVIRLKNTIKIKDSYEEVFKKKITELLRKIRLLEREGVKTGTTQGNLKKISTFRNMTIYNYDDFCISSQKDNPGYKPFEIIEFKEDEDFGLKIIDNDDNHKCISCYSNLRIKDQSYSCGHVVKICKDCLERSGKANMLYNKESSVSCIECKIGSIKIDNLKKKKVVNIN